MKEKQEEQEENGTQAVIGGMRLGAIGAFVVSFLPVFVLLSLLVCFCDWNSQPRK